MIPSDFSTGTREYIHSIESHLLRRRKNSHRIQQEDNILQFKMKVPRRVIPGFSIRKYTIVRLSIPPSEPP